MDGVTKEKSELSDVIDRLQMHMNSQMVSKCALGENLLSGSHGAQVAGDQAKAPIVRLAELENSSSSCREGQQL